MGQEHIVLSNAMLKLVGPEIHKALIGEIGNLVHKLKHAISYSTRDSLTAKISTVNGICQQIHEKNHLIKVEEEADCIDATSGAEEQPIAELQSEV